MTDPTYILLALSLLLMAAGWVVARNNWHLTPYQQQVRTHMVRVTANIRELSNALDLAGEAARRANETMKAIEETMRGPSR